ncbi:hypothetical protein [Hyphomonas sp.]|uniref:hypothetical protein n=1 Tax=Hyphomonas sp. TaxID=87 RepID=UPI00352922B6
MPPVEPQAAIRPIHAIRGHVHIAFRQVLALIGLFMILIAIPIGFATPFIPVGLPIAIMGVVLLGRNAGWGRRWMERVMARHPHVERFAPHWLMRLVFGREKTTVSQNDAK